MDLEAELESLATEAEALGAKINAALEEIRARVKDRYFAVAHPVHQEPAQANANRFAGDVAALFFTATGKPFNDLHVVVEAFKLRRRVTAAEFVERWTRLLNEQLPPAA